jgi:V/A-type H+-transporting ATPase subunit C
MPQTSYPYAIGRVKALETRVLNTDKLRKLAGVSLEEFLKALRDANYGGGALNDEPLEAAVKKELREAKRFIWEITPEPAVTRLFFLPTDACNLKIILKARLLSKQPEGLWEEGGAFPPEELCEAVRSGSYVFLPSPLKDDLQEAEKFLSRDPSPWRLSAQVDRAVFNYIKNTLAERRSEYAESYFSLLSDFINLKSFVRARRLCWEEQRFFFSFLPGGSVGRMDFRRAYLAPDEQLAASLNKGMHGPLLAAALDEYFSQNSAAALERKLTGFLSRFVYLRRRDSDGLGPIIGYLLGKEAEAGALELIHTALGLSAEPVLPELYL